MKTRNLAGTLRPEVTPIRAAGYSDTRRGCLKILALLLACLTPGALHGQVTFRVAPAAGLAGFQKAVVDVRQAFDVTDGAAVPVAGFDDVRASLRWTWSLVGAAGIEILPVHFGTGDGQRHLGVGALIAAVSNTNGETFYPAATIVYGNDDYGISAGVIFGPGDRLLVEDESVRVPAGSGLDFVLLDGGAPLALMVALRISGATFGAP